MVNKSLQKERMMRYFIDACKVVVHRDGLEGVTAKKVGIESGYSYATLYNYFESLEELIFYCCFDYIAELGRQVEKSLDSSLSGWEQLHASLDAFINFAVDHTLEFKLIFMMDEKKMNFSDAPPEMVEALNNPKMISVFNEIYWGIAKSYGKSYEEFKMLFEICVSFAFKKLYFNTIGDNKMGADQILESIMEMARFIIE